MHCTAAAYTATEQQLAEFFGAMGEVTNISIARCVLQHISWIGNHARCALLKTAENALHNRNKDDGRPRGFAHVSFADAASASTF